MVQKLRQRSNGEDGFTLVELLVVMLILGLLAAIAIPSFFNQRDKAQDADAKATVRTAQTAMETFATDNDGSYGGVTEGDLTTIENTLDAEQLTAVAEADGGDGYSITATSSTGNTFTIDRDGVTGQSTYTCTATGEGGCPTNGSWAGEAEDPA